jgi:hypothetical protein
MEQRVSEVLTIQIRQQQDGLKESLRLLDDSLSSPDALHSQLDKDEFQAEGSEHTATSSDSVINIERLPPNPLHLNISRCIAFQSLNETSDGSDEASMDFTHLHIRDLASGPEQAAFVRRDIGFTSSTNEEAMMSYHKEILFAEFRDLLRNHPQGGAMTVDAHKLRILLDLMHRHSCRLEDQLRSCYGMTDTRSPDYDCNASSSAGDSSEPSSFGSSLYSQQKCD